ncbi:PTS system D-fructose-specific IIB component (F1P-forming), Frc family /PTS system D-fructose-specific IIC component (F1P-forming), Frc family [Actinopolyspora mzabensis]|uniref:PTS system D-fructose-specific IIB component (F1P-forming), Frc family /PTS system D-fructose-specific IIC component (F1P-forming), Frc family n=1 Tax=Actinopolyspora mzabensis TaxID=995066 RepID=A0A1G8Z484_ACTMZ|nr:fructose-specific PTS transporter subunit EIIC [Actinopolyspora mzabensis]SDK09939.1 PTS system D-fructose-specific IIB component (F1P-forming), Frc family /PTS system D-fructose-specific IIC component (F1P-forming), Frc family [Actinopolyspora mzabensis]
MKFVAVTACPTGIAHTYMAAEALEQAARNRGDELSVETQGAAGSDPLSEQDINAADAVILAADVGVTDRDRFAGKPVVEASVKQAVDSAASLLERAATAEPMRVGSGSEGPSSEPATKVTANASAAVRLRQWLMTGVSYVIPFVAAGGLLIALSFALGGYQITEAPDVTERFDPASLTSWAALANQIGTAAFEFLVPVLAGFIAFAMAERPALVPGFVGGAAAVAVGAGFLGGLIAGLLAGGVVLGLRRVRVPSAVAGIMPVVVIPLFGSMVVGTLMFVVLGKPIAAAMTALTAWLNGLSGANAMLLGAVLGGMIAFDLGGPVNKVAYTFAVGGLTTGSETALEIMAAVMAAGMVPPLAMALAATVHARSFSPGERESSRPAWLLGASFITEGAIPFAASDPFRVIPSMILGSASAGALSMLFGATLRAPHGGLFVLPLVGSPLLYLLAILTGVLVAAAVVLATKSFVGRGPAAAEQISETERAVAA